MNLQLIILIVATRYACANFLEKQDLFFRDKIFFYHVILTLKVLLHNRLLRNETERAVTEVAFIPQMHGSRAVNGHSHPPRGRFSIYCVCN